MLGLLVKLFTDAYFKVGTLDTAQLVASNNVPVFQYRSEIPNDCSCMQLGRNSIKPGKS